MLSTRVLWSGVGVVGVVGVFVEGALDDGAGDNDESDVGDVVGGRRAGD